MKVLVVGGGGREHALCWALAASPVCDALYCAPGNAGIAQEATCLPIKADDLDGLEKAAADYAIDLAVIGPEAPLVAGLADRLRGAGLRVFGPGADAAALEGSKAFMKELAEEAGVPTAQHRTFTDYDSALAYVRERGLPLAIKADGLASGKGVTVAETDDEAEQALRQALIERRFGAAGARVVVEDYLDGEEASLFALVDGKVALPLVAAQDHKAIGEGETGPNTGGMGAYSPATPVTPEMERRLTKEIIQPMVDALTARGLSYVGVFFAGLMLTERGPRLLEVNVRFGDPEAQAILPRLESDLLPALVAACDGQFKAFDLRWSDEAALAVVLAAQGYPGGYRKGTAINGVEAAGDDENRLVFHAGTARAGDGQLIADGGRVLTVVGLGPDLAAARQRAYQGVAAIAWDDGYYRRDIGWRGLNRA